MLIMIMSSKQKQCNCRMNDNNIHSLSSAVSRRPCRPSPHPHNGQPSCQHHSVQHCKWSHTKLPHFSPIRRKIPTVHQKSLLLRLRPQGQIQLGDKLVHLASTNILASNGIIHMIDGLLYPPSILPILPKRCDVVDSNIIMVSKHLDATPA